MSLASLDASDIFVYFYSITRGRRPGSKASGLRVKRTSPICWTCSVWLMAVQLVSVAHADDWRLSIRAAAVNPPVRTIPHIANGAGWRTTVILVNTATQA